MNKLTEIIPEFVDTIPDKLEYGKIYISEKYKTATHLCACGCGNRVVTPTKNGFWNIEILYSDPLQVSLSPSIGNFNLPCKSHYFIKNNRIEWI